MTKLSMTLLLFALVSSSVGQTRRPDTNVRRAAPGTPEMTSMAPTLGELENGKQAEICLRDKPEKFPTANQKFTASGTCKLIQGGMKSPAIACFTVISTSEEGGSCSLEVRGSGGAGGVDRIASGSLSVKPTAAIAAQRKKEEDERQAKEMAEGKAVQEMFAKAPATVGKKWSVVLPNGKSDTWTWVAEAFGGGKFKSGSGEEVTIMVQPESKIMAIIGEGCVFGGSLSGNKVTGMAEMPPSLCKHGQGKWTATIAK
jgi:hypothetical protein